MPARQSSASAAAWPTVPQSAAAARIRALLPLPGARGMQLLDGVFVGVDEPHETGGERLVFDIRAGPRAR